MTIKKSTASEWWRVSYQCLGVYSDLCVRERSLNMVQNEELLQRNYSSVHSEWNMCKCEEIALVVQEYQRVGSLKILSVELWCLQEVRKIQRVC